MSDNPITKVGFTGSREEPPSDQKMGVLRLLADYRNAALVRPEFHHGDCVGADAWAAWAAYRMGFIVVSHPPIDDKLRANTSYGEILKPKKYLDRNADIVNATEVMIAMPRYAQGRGSNGTWWTVRYARTKGRVVHVVDLR